jgi:hypothetical protein
MCQAEPNRGARLPVDSKLQSFCLLNGPFRADQQIRKLRNYMGLGDNLVVAITQAVDNMQKALFEMNV